MPKKIITWKEADAALIRLAVAAIEQMEQLSRMRINYDTIGEFVGPQFDESAFSEPIAADPFSATRYLAGISGFTDQIGDRRGMESIPGLPKACTWAFVAVTIQNLREARAELKGLCYPQVKRKVLGPVLTRNK